MNINVPIREKKTFMLDNGMTIEKWEKIGSKDFEVETDKVSEDEKKEIESAPDVIWWGVFQLPVPGRGTMPFHFQIDGDTIEDIAGKFESRLQAALKELEEEEKKMRNQIQTPNPADIEALNRGFQHPTPTN